MSARKNERYAGALVREHGGVLSCTGAQMSADVRKRAASCECTPIAALFPAAAGVGMRSKL